VVFLEHFRGTRDVAEFRAVVPVAALNLVALQSFKFLFTPLAARMYAKNEKEGINELYWQTAIWISLITFPVFAVTFLFAEPLTVLLFGSEYAQSGIILSILAAGNYFNAVVGYNQYTLRVYDLVRVTVIIDILSAVVSVLLSLWIIPRYGALGAAISTCSTVVIYNILKQIGLGMRTDINLFHWVYVKVYFSILVGVFTLFSVQYIGALPFPVSVALVILISLLLIRFNRKTLNIVETFPELLKIPLLKPVLGL